MHKKVLNINVLIFRRERHNSDDEVNRVKGSPIDFVVGGRRRTARKVENRWFSVEMVHNRDGFRQRRENNEFSNNFFYYNAIKI